MNQDNLALNLDRMCGLLAAGANRNGKSVGLELERFLIDRSGRTVPYEGERGVAALLGKMADGRPANELVEVDGHLMGLSYAVETKLGSVPVTVSLEPAAQIEASVGPAPSAQALYLALEAFDRDVKDALGELGLDAHLVARGYNPTASSPLDLELIPKERYRNMDAYLSRRGRFARDMMRATASTQVSLDYANEADAMGLMRRAVVLGPVFAFLFDNAPVFRGVPSPGMARSRIWREMDPDRCGTVPGSLDDDFDFRAYAKWVSGVKPILFTDRDHVTTPTGDRTAADVMAAEKLTDGELAHLMSMVFPNVRLKGFLEYREMDALPPRLAAACAWIVAGILYHPERLGELPFRIDDQTEESVERARAGLEESGWEARPYGAPIADTAQALLGIAEGSVEGEFDRKSLELLRDMWLNERSLPRDLAYERLATLS